MASNGQLRGHPIYWDGQDWRYCDNHEPTESTWRDRSCGYCGLHETPEGHDPCIGTLHGVQNACCGHGMEGEAYIQYPGGACLRGEAAIREMNRQIAERHRTGGEVAYLEERQPHCTVQGVSGTVHVIPAALFRDIGAGRMCLTDIDDWEDIAPVIVRDWLRMSAERDGVEL